MPEEVGCMPALSEFPKELGLVEHVLKLGHAILGLVPCEFLNGGDHRLGQQEGCCCGIPCGWHDDAATECDIGQMVYR